MNKFFLYLLLGFGLATSALGQYFPPPSGTPDLTGLVPKTTTVNGHALSGNVSLTSSDVGAPSGSGTSSGSNSGDETTSTIKTKLGLSGSITVSLGKTLNATNSLTFSGTDGSTLNIGGGGTLGSNAYTSTSYAPVASPAFTGSPNAPTQTTGDNTTKIATDQFVNNTVSSPAKITGLPEDTAPDPAADYFTTYDASAAALKKVKLSNFAAQLTITNLNDSTDPTKQLKFDLSGMPTGTTYTVVPYVNEDGTVNFGGPQKIFKVTGISLTATSTTAAYTVPTGANFIVTGMSAIITSVTGYSSTTLPVIGVKDSGTNGTMASISGLSSWNAVGKVMNANMPNLVGQFSAAGNAVNIVVSTASSSTTMVVTVIITGIQY